MSDHPNYQILIHEERIARARALKANDRPNYQSLGVEERKALARQLGRVDQAQIERPTGVPERQLKAPAPAIDHEGALEAQRDARVNQLAQERASGKIDRHEQIYQLNKFDNNPVALDRRLGVSAPTQEQPRPSSRHLGANDRADLVSQGDLALQLQKRKELTRKLGKEKPTIGLEKKDDLSIKPPEIKR